MCGVSATAWSGTAHPPHGCGCRPVWVWPLGLQDTEDLDRGGAEGGAEGEGGGGTAGGERSSEDDHQTSSAGRRESFWSPEHPPF